MLKVKRHSKKVFGLSELQHLVLTSCVWLSRSSWSLGDSGDLHAVKRACPVQVSRLCLEWPRGVREKVTVLALRFPWTNASSLRTSKHTLHNTSSIQFMTVWQIERSKFPNASEDAQEEEEWAPLSGQVSQNDASCLPQQHIVPSQQYAAQVYNAKQSNMLGHYRREQGFWASGAGVWALMFEYTQIIIKIFVN